MKNRIFHSSILKSCTGSQICTHKVDVLLALVCEQFDQVPFECFNALGSLPETLTGPAGPYLDR
jgi:hypothetical protein